MAKLICLESHLNLNLYPRLKLTPGGSPYGPSHIIHFSFRPCRFSRESYVSIPPSRQVPMPRAPSTAAKSKVKKKKKKQPVQQKQPKTQKRKQLRSKFNQPAVSFSAAERQKIPPLTFARCNSSDAHVDCVQKSECKGEVAICV